MKPIVLAVLAAALLAGCTAGAEDPLAYTKKPLFASGFDLGTMRGSSQTQEFRVTDGSIGEIRAQVWINATQGGATVEIVDPKGIVLLTTSEAHTQTAFGLDLGAWKVRVAAQPGSAGLVHVLVTRG